MFASDCPFDMKRMKLARGDIKLNEPVPWSLYGANGQLLLRQGRVVKSEEILHKIFQHDPYRNEGMLLGEVMPSTRPSNTLLKPKQPEKVNPFNEITRFSTRYKNLVNGIDREEKATTERVYRLAEDIQSLVEYDEDACLGAIHLYYDQKYTALQPVYKAILCELCGILLNYDKIQRRSLLAAALTSNLGLITIQDQLNNQNAPLTKHQLELIHKAPARAVEMLKDAGVEDQVWLKTVIENHERNDGSGYPWGLKSKFISPFAKILGLADTYVAMINKRADRDAVLAQSALQEIYQMSSEEDRQIYTSFIQQLGAFPPGTLVRLANDEIAVVTYRGFGNSIMSSAVSIGSKPGHLYASPFQRDTSEEEYSITRIYNPSTKPHLNPDVLWSYT